MEGSTEGAALCCFCGFARGKSISIVRDMVELSVRAKSPGSKMGRKTSSED